MDNLILLVEDNPSDEKLTLHAFKNCGVENRIEVVRDGAAALDFLFARGAFANRADLALPALVLLDLNLPKVDGLEVLRQLRAHERTRVLSVVIMTASAEDEDILKSYMEGANAYVRKPLEFGRHAEAARSVGLFWLLWNRRPTT